MSFKSIIFPFSGNKREFLCLEYSFLFAKKFGSQVRIINIIPDPNTAMIAAFPTIGPAVPAFGDFVNDLVKLNEKEKNVLMAKCQEVAKNHGIRFSDKSKETLSPSAIFEHKTGLASQIISDSGRYSDIVIIDRDIEKAGESYSDAIIASIFQTGRPTVIIPNSYSKESIAERIVIAWNDSRESSRALASSLPLLKKAKEVFAINVTDEKKKSSSLDRLVSYLEIHDIGVEAKAIDSRGGSAGEIILKEAKKVNSDLIVMGAFSHSRIRQMVLGGVTSHMLEKTEIPIIMAH